MEADLPRGLSGERVLLTPLLESDSPTLFRWINDPDLVRLNASYAPVTEKQHQAWFDRVRTSSDPLVFAIRAKQDGRLIGSCQLHHIHAVHRSAELQIRIGGETDRGAGLGSEAISLLLRFAFRDLNLNRVYLHVFATNERAVRAYLKNGFAEEGLLRQAAFIDGRFVDVKVLGCLRDAWLANASR